MARTCGEDGCGHRSCRACFGTAQAPRDGGACYRCSVTEEDEHLIECVMCNRTLCVPCANQHAYCGRECERADGANTERQAINGNGTEGAARR